jgi:hypothetical protein
MQTCTASRAEVWVVRVGSQRIVLVEQASASVGMWNFAASLKAARGRRKNRRSVDCRKSSRMACHFFQGRKLNGGSVGNLFEISS